MPPASPLRCFFVYLFLKQVLTMYPRPGTGTCDALASASQVLGLQMYTIALGSWSPVFIILRKAWDKPGKIVHGTLPRKTHHTEKRAGVMAQGVVPEFKPWYCKKKKSLAEWMSHK
jgi:hypothetical protein